MPLFTLPTMEIVSSPIPGGVWVLGFFDGVHRGHRKLLKTAAALAKKRQSETGEPCPVGVWTFTALPKAKELLTDPPERAALLGENGVTQLSMVDFPSVSRLSGMAFFQDILCAGLAPSALVCGFNFRFGYNGECGAADLTRWGAESGIHVQIVPPCETEGRTVSSTWIRSLVREGDAEKAAVLLTRPYSITGVVEHGKALGRKLGFPTANLRLPEGKTAPKSGIYACIARFTEEDGMEKRLPGVCNIGSRPTVNGDREDITVETWILDYSGNLYGRTLTIDLCSRIRDEMKFPSLEALSARIAADAQAARAYFQKNPL